MKAIVYLRDGEVEEVELVNAFSYLPAALRAENKINKEGDNLIDMDYVVMNPTSININDKGEVIE